ncbi:MAG TPA: carbamoyltransferase C-terminal domain-containing protein [Bryobacteraceae bacterium]|nr:carbamoyltransferase C-terminal domain-containing protein [Bryobacteraceae bacterium]
MEILGLNAFHGDASAALLSDGQLVAAVEEERFNRIKHWAGFPALAAKACIRGIDPASLAHVAISRDPRAHLWRKLARVAVRPGDWPRLASRARNTIQVANLASALSSSGVTRADQVRIHHVEHHRAHLASAFFASPFEEAAVVSIDGFGDFSSLMWGVGKNNRFDVHGTVRFPHSLGLFYTAFTQFLGFPKYGDEYKMMGLSAYGEPRFASQVRDVVHITGGQVRLNLDYFIHHTEGVEMTWNDCEPSLGRVYSARLPEVFGAPRVPRSELEQRHADLAASVQAVLEEQYFEILNFVQRKTRLKKLCLAGGVALNCVANGMIFDKTPFQDVYIQAASHDAGTSIGAALYVAHQVLKQPRSFVMRHVYYGPEYTESEIRKELDDAGVQYHPLAGEELVDRTARQIADGQIVGWFQGRMEFGPRALGNRSILADPRRHDMKDILNKRIKFREPFRPFCPSVLAEATGEFFETDYPSPFMVQAYRIKPQQRERIPAVTHRDGTGRLQTVEKDVNPLYWNLIRRFGDLTGVPILINTSFNENEPIVNTPREALDCFLRTNMDVLVIGPFFLSKSENLQHSHSRASFVAEA